MIVKISHYVVLILLTVPNSFCFNTILTFRLLDEQVRVYSKVSFYDYVKR